MAGAVLSSNVLQVARRNLTVTPAMRDLARAILDAEFAAALAMTDDVFWGYDASWFTAPDKARLLDVKQPGMAGGGGRNQSLNNNQFWDVQEPCSRGLFALVLYQQRRYMAAQIRLAKLLRQAPQPEIIAGFDNYVANPARGVRAACSGVSTRDAADRWAAWIEDVLAVIGAAQWATNFTWSELPRSCADAAAPSAAYIGARPVGGNAPGCVYEPECLVDEYGVPMLGYIVGRSNKGLRALALMPGAPTSTFAGPVTRDDVSAGRLPNFMRGDYGAATSARVVSGASYALMPLSRAPRVLGLHRNDRLTPPFSVEVPTGLDAFRPALRASAALPNFLRQPTPGDVNSFLREAMLEWPNTFETDGAAYQDVLRLREQTGYWGWHDRGKHFNTAIGSELLIWQVFAMAREITDTAFGQVIIDGFDNLDLTLKNIPVEWRTGPMASALAAISAAAAQIHNARAETVGAAMSGAAAVATAVLPIAGVIVGILGGLVTALTRFQMDLGLTRRANPPVLQAPAARVSSVGLEAGEDRCWVNPGPGESLEQYEARVTSTYRASARATGGNPAAMFDEIARQRMAAWCAANPGAPQCQPPRSSSWGRWLAGAAGTTAGFALIKLLGG